MVAEGEAGKGAKRQKIVGLTPLNVKILWALLPFICGGLAYYVDVQKKIAQLESNERNDAKYASKGYIKYLEKRITKLEDRINELGRRNQSST